MHASRRLERVAKGGNAQEGTCEETVGALGESSLAKVWGQDPTVGDHISNNGPHTKMEG